MTMGTYIVCQLMGNRGRKQEDGSIVLDLTHGVVQQKRMQKGNQH